MSAYISGPLQAAIDLPEARDLYELLAEIVYECGVEPYVPHMHTDPERAAHVSAVDVFRRDVAALLDCDVLIAHIGAPSTGVGAELAIAKQAGITIIGIARSDEPTSRFASGLIAEAGGLIIHFTNDQDLRRQVRSAVSAVAMPRSQQAMG